MKLKTMMARPWLFLLWLAIIFISAQTHAQEKKLGVPDGTEGEFFPLGDTAVRIKTEKKTPWNEFNFGFTTFKFGGGYLYEFAAYSQDKNSKIQTDSLGASLNPAFKTRDARILFSGKFNTKRLFTWKAGFMYDGVTDSWFVRETGLTVGVPEIWGNIFVGRTKEGFSLNKIMNGYSGWTMERQMALDVIPILADGVKWMAYLPKQKLFWNLGIFTDWLSHKESFSTFKWQAVARVAWLPIFEKDNVLHLGANFRYGDPEDGKMRLKSRPEVNAAPFFIDTKEFAASHSNSFGPEIYYARGPLMFGTEYYFHNFTSPKTTYNFNGGDIVASYIFTGESRPYSTSGGIFTFVPVKKSIFHGGWGSWEGVLRLSHLDLDSHDIHGGKFWRLTPMVNWYMSPNFRLELAYGYGVLNRFNLSGGTQFFQARIQMILL